MTDKTKFANAKRAQVMNATGSKSMQDVTIRVDVDNARGEADVSFSIYDTIATIRLTADERLALAKALWSTLS